MTKFLGIAIGLGMTLRSFGTLMQGTEETVWYMGGLIVGIGGIFLCGLIPEEKL